MHWESNCGQDKKYQCGICSAKFITHASLKAHMLIHVGEKKFQCSCCPKSFLSQGQLKVHMRHVSWYRRMKWGILYIDDYDR